MDQQKGILQLQVSLDAAAQVLLCEFLALNPSRDQILSFVGVPQHRSFYDEHSRQASYVTVSGKTVVCFVVPGLDAEKAKEIETRLHVAHGHNSNWMTGFDFARVVASVVGQALPIVPFKG